MCSHHVQAINETLAQLLMVMEKLDDRIGPMLEQVRGEQLRGRALCQRQRASFY